MKKLFLALIILGFMGLPVFAQPGSHSMYEEQLQRNQQNQEIRRLEQQQQWENMQLDRIEQQQREIHEDQQWQQMEQDRQQIEDIYKDDDEDRNEDD